MIDKANQARRQKRATAPMLTLMFKPLMSLVALLLLTSCSTYSGKFACGDSRGANCVMLSEVDKRIDSGEIEEVYKDKKCSGGKCKAKAKEEAEPSLKSNQSHTALIIDDKDESDRIEGNTLYLGN